MTTSGASIAARAAARSNVDRPAPRPVEDEMAGDPDPELRGIEHGRRYRHGPPPRRPADRPPRAPRRSASRALPAAPAMRPQFGSRPWAAALTRLDETTARATARASASSRAPVTAAVMSVRRALAVGRLLARQVPRDRLDRRARERPRPATGLDRRGPRAPRTPGRRRCRSCSCRHRPRAGSRSAPRPAGAAPTGPRAPTVASVRMTDSIVAICGWIIPTPLATPLTRTVDRPAVGRGQLDGRGRDLDHANRSCAAPSPRPRAARHRSRPASARAPSSPPRPASSGSRVPMIPVDRCERPVELASPVAAASIRAISSLVGVAGGTGRRVRAAARRDDRLAQP